jgi:amidohydrolase
MNPLYLALILSLFGIASCSLLDDAQKLQPWIVAQRRALHAIPELGFHEFKTSAHIKDVLSSLGITPLSGLAGNSSTAVIASLGSGTPVVILRADIDALPVNEPEGLEYRSTHPGVMHACGHDSHTAMLIGAARILKSIHDKTSGGIKGTIKLVFQPFEEGGAGADVLLKDPKSSLDSAEAAFGLHVMPTLPSGKVSTYPGTLLAGALSYEITITGRGGHAALPHLNVDPVVASSALISSLQTLVSRETSPLASSVVSVTLVRAGDGAFNVIPSTSTLGGTIRALTLDQLLKLKARVEEMAPLIVAGFGCNATVDWRLDEQPLYPPTVNDKALTNDFSSMVARDLFGAEHFEEAEPIMGGEDFGFFCLKMPCTFFFLGIRNENAGSVHALHNPRFTLDEEVLFKGSALLSSLALRYLERASKGGSGREEL